MSLVDSVYQYQNSTAANSHAMNQAKETGAVQKAATQAQQLMAGKVFEGTITDIKNGQVTIGLNDGSTISARMDTGVSLEKGQPMLFEVKSNNGEQIAIRPVTLESAQNPTLLKALEAAGLKVNERNLSMVNQMMAEKMPINKESLLQMLRASSAFPKADMQTLVQMQKLGFVITEESLNQFQNYKNGQQAILPDMNRLMQGIMELPGQILSSGGNGAAAQSPGFLLGLQQQILGIILGDGQQPVTEGQLGNVQGQPVLGEQAGVLGETILNGNISGEDIAGAIGERQLTGGIAGEMQMPGAAAGGITGDGQLAGSISGEMQMPGGIAGGISGEGQLVVGIAGEAPLPEGAVGEGQLVVGIAGDNLSQCNTAAANQAGESAQAQALADGNGTPVSVAQLLSGEQQGRLSALLQEFSGAKGNEQLLPNGQLNTSLGAGELLQQIMDVLVQSKEASSASMQKLFHSEEYKGLLKQAMTEQWLLTPEKLKEEGAVKEFYQRLSSQMSELQQTLAQAGKDGSVLAKSAQSVQSNLEFMNQVNQLYTYVQLPLKLQNQDAHSDLYVYTNKKNLRQKEGELTALLHLDMDHLGATDIFVKLMGSDVRTEFYFEDENSCRLISQYSQELIERLQEKGYSCDVKVEHRKKKEDFVQDFLERENPPGKLQRYSFDVKA